MSDLSKAVQIYRSFRETEPRRAQRYNIKLPKALARMGPCEFIGYMTTHNGKVALYVHEFATGSRPILYAGPRHQQLYLIGGRYHVTSGGITDRDARGRIVDAPRRYQIRILPRRSR
jgi:hypothetical protein